MPDASYTGRFAPSPTGPLHAGSLVAALASWLDAKAHQGRWLIRIEDVDTPRCVPGADQTLLHQLAACGLVPDEPPVYQSRRSAMYQAALDRLVTQDLAYGCACSRKDIAVAMAAHGMQRQRHGEQIYPGTCRPGLQGRTARAWRLRTDIQMPSGQLSATGAGLFATNTAAKAASSTPLQWHDRRLGPQQQDVAREVGDFVLRRADGFWAYQLAVVVDDAAQGITHVVRGEDLADNTARQLLLQRALGCAAPSYLHTPLVRGLNGEKLSKQNGAAALDLQNPVQALREAFQALDLKVADACSTVPHLLAWGVQVWAAQWGTSGSSNHCPAH